MLESARSYMKGAHIIAFANIGIISLSLIEGLMQLWYLIKID
jgi:hypothetical protein